MSQNDKNNPVIPDMDFSALDGELAQMAAETPEVPTDFHAAWVKRVREEAAAQGAGKVTNTKKESNRRQWRHLASVAAAFVLLIGGVILAWNQKNGGQPASGRTVNQQTQQTSEKAAEKSSPDQEEQEQVSDEEINMASAEEPMEPGNEMEWAGEEDSVYIEDEAVGLAAVLRKIWLRQKLKKSWKTWQPRKAPRKRQKKAERAMDSLADRIMVQKTRRTMEVHRKP